MKKKLVTVSISMARGELEAQCKSSKKMLMNRLYADDEIWSSISYKKSFQMKKMFDKKFFNNGLAFKFTPFPKMEEAQT